MNNMNNYEILLECAKEKGLIVKEKKMNCNADGLIKGNKILINKGADTTRKACTLLEEIEHHETTVGNILGQITPLDKRQERLTRFRAYNKLVGLTGILDAYRYGCQSAHEMSEYLEVPEDILVDALDMYKQKYGAFIALDNYIIYFSPNIGVVEML